MPNLTISEMYLFLTSDFEGAWDSIAVNLDNTIGRGNFTFALKAMILLEWGSRLCFNCPALLSSLTKELQTIEPRYFTRIRGITHKHVGIKEKKLMLPYTGSGPKHEHLLWILFDLIRNGEAHQYQQIESHFSDGTEFVVVLNGADCGHTLDSIRASKVQLRADHHLSFRRDPGGRLGLTVMPELLYLDFKGAIDMADIPRKASSFPYLGPRNYPLSATTLNSSSFRRDTIHLFSNPSDGRRGGS